MMKRRALFGLIPASLIALLPTSVKAQPKEETLAEKFKNILDIQRRCTDDEPNAYMTGMLNGMELIVACHDGTEYDPRDILKSPAAEAAEGKFTCIGTADGGVNKNSDCYLPIKHKD